MLKKKRKHQSSEEIEINKELKSLQGKRRVLVRKIDDIDTEMLGLRERLLFLKKESLKKESQL